MRHATLTIAVFEDKLREQQYAGLTGARRAIGKANWSEQDKEHARRLADAYFGAQAPGAAPGKRPAPPPPPPPAPPARRGRPPTPAAASPAASKKKASPPPAPPVEAARRSHPPTSKKKVPSPPPAPKAASKPAPKAAPKASPKTAAASRTVPLPFSAPPAAAAVPATASAATPALAAAPPDAPRTDPVAGAAGPQDRLLVVVDPHQTPPPRAYPTPPPAVRLETSGSIVAILAQLQLSRDLTDDEKTMYELQVWYHTHNLKEFRTASDIVRRGIKIPGPLKHQARPAPPAGDTPGAVAPETFNGAGRIALDTPPAGDPGD